MSVAAVWDEDDFPVTPKSSPSEKMHPENHCCRPCRAADVGLFWYSVFQVHLIMEDSCDFNFINLNFSVKNDVSACFKP